MLKFSHDVLLPETIDFEVWVEDPPAGGPHKIPCAGFAAYYPHSLTYQAGKHTTMPARTLSSGYPAAPNISDYPQLLGKQLTVIATKTAAVVFGAKSQLRHQTQRHPQQLPRLPAAGAAAQGAAGRE
jgi:hypothetical protein